MSWMGIESLKEAEMGLYEVSQFGACDYITIPRKRAQACFSAA